MQQRIKNHKPLILGIMLVTILVVVLMIYIRRESAEEKPRLRLSVILEESDDERLEGMKAGMEQAAKDNGCILNFPHTGLLSATDERRLMEEELSQGAQGILLQPVSSDDMFEVLEQFSGRTQLLLLESDISQEGVYPAVTADDYSLGKSLADEVLVYVRGKTAPRVVVLVGHGRQRARQKRMDGVREVLQAAGAEVFVLSSSVNGLPSLLERELAENGADAVVAVGDAETDTVAAFLSELEAGTEEQDDIPPFFGVGGSAKNLYFLEHGIIRRLVVPNAFMMGYQAVQALASQVEYKTSFSVRPEQVEYLIVGSENLYDEENQKALFPIMQ